MTVASRLTADLEAILDRWQRKGLRLPELLGNWRVSWVEDAGARSSPMSTDACISGDPTKLSPVVERLNRWVDEGLIQIEVD